MKPYHLNDTTGFIFQAFELDPNVIKAQRMAELEQLAKYRAEKIWCYTEWSKDPQKVRVALGKKLDQVGEEIMKSMPLAPKLYPEYKVPKFAYGKLEDRIEIKPIVKVATEVALPWYKRLWQFIVG